jgi:hypothetical protein
MERPIHFLPVSPSISSEPGKDGPEETENWSARATTPDWMRGGLARVLNVIPEGSSNAKAQTDRAIVCGDIVCVVSTTPAPVQHEDAPRLHIDVEELSGNAARWRAPVTIRVARAASS